MPNLPSVEVDITQKKTKAPRLVWEDDGYRLVVVYYASGSPPTPILEKLSGTDSLGKETWHKVDVTTWPKTILKSLAILASGDDHILQN